MEWSAAQLALFAAAVWTWLWLIFVLDRTVPLARCVQQRLGVSTPRLVCRLEQGRRWLVASGLIVIGVACIWSEVRTATLFGLFAGSAVLLMYALTGSAKLLQPRLLTSLFAQLHGDTSHDRFVDKIIMLLYEYRPQGPPPAAA